MSAYRIGMVMGSDSDLPIMEKALEMLDKFGIDAEVRVLSAHRTPDQALEFARTARERGLQVIIAAAGGAAHLPGVVAAVTTLPVIGVPIESKLQGLDSLLSIVQMPSGVPVATVAVNGAANAAILAAQIIGVGDAEMAARLAAYKHELAEQSLAKNQKLADKLASRMAH